MLVCYEDDDGLNVWWEPPVEDIQVVEKIASILEIGSFMFAGAHEYS